MQLSEQNQRIASEKLTKRQCQSFYPDGDDGSTFFELETNFGSRDKVEELLVLCGYDFAVASDLATLCHYNFRAVKDFVGRFGNNSEIAREYLKRCKNAQPQKAPTTHCKAALNTLKAFRGKENIASEFVMKFDSSDNVQHFLDKFDFSGEQANSYLTAF